MGLSSKTLPLTPVRVTSALFVIAMGGIAGAQPASVSPPASASPPASVSAPPASGSAAAPIQPAPLAAVPPPVPPAPNAPAAPGAAPMPPPPPGYTAPAYVGPYAPPAYPPPSEPPLPPPAPPDNRTISLTLAPLELLVGPIVQIEGEYRVAQHVGFALIGGYGELKLDSYDSNGNTYKTTLNTFEIGSQVNVYPSKPFKGLDLGAELTYVKVDTNNIAQTQVSGIGVGLAIGPLVGYKIITDGGFTFVAQGGISYLAVQSEQKDPSGLGQRKSSSSYVPNLHLNLGWSF